MAVTLASALALKNGKAGLDRNAVSDGSTRKAGKQTRNHIFYDQESPGHHEHLDSASLPAVSEVESASASA